MNGSERILETHQQRVVDEKNELDTKLSLLNGFLQTPFFETLDIEEQRRLGYQSDVMGKYLGILNERIDAF